MARPLAAILWLARRANAVLEVIETEKLTENAVKIGDYLIQSMQKLQEKYPALIAEVRGKGLMVGVELTRPGRDLVDLCLARGAIINCTAGNVLRFVPPLGIGKEHVDEVVAIADGVLAEWQ